MTNDWKKIRPDFTSELQWEWESSGFNYDQCKEWIDAGLQLADNKFAHWLSEKTYIPQWVYNFGNLEELRGEYSEELNNREIANKIKVENKKGAKKNYSFLEEEIIREEVNAQQWLYSRPEYNTPEKRAQTTKLEIYNRNLTGDLDLTDFVNLKTLYCQENQLTNLNLNGLDELKELNCRNNKLTELKLENCSNIDSLDVSHNEFFGGNLSIFSHLVNLEELNLNLTCLTGSLKPLKSCSKLKDLYIGETDVDSGLEYLPETVETIWCSVCVKPASKAKAIREELNSNLLFGFEASKFENNEYVRNWQNIYPNFTEELQKKWKIRGFTYQQTKKWIEAGLQPGDVELATYLKWKGYQPQQSLDLTQLRKEFTPWLAGNKNAQTYLDSFYPKEERQKWKIKELNLRNLNLEGDLDLSGFTWKLKKIYVAGNPRLGEIKNIKKAAVIHENTQQWWEKNYPNKEQVETVFLSKGLEIIDQTSELIITDCPRLREIKSDWFIYKTNKLIIANCPQLERIDINNFRGVQELKITNCLNLKEIDCDNNRLTSLNILNCPQLEKIYCRGNQLTSLDLSSCPNLEVVNCFNNLLTEIKLSILGKKLKALDLRDNNFSKQDLNFLSHLVDLKELRLGNYNQEKIQQGIFNRFTGSLETLKTMNELAILDISNTDVDSSPECLPNAIEVFYCSANERPDSKVKIIAEELNKLDNSDSIFALKLWKMDKKRSELFDENLVLKSKVKEFENSQQAKQSTEQKIIERQAQEIVSLRSKDLTTQILNKTAEWKQLISDAKSKAGTNLARTVDLLLNAQIAISKEPEENENIFARGQLTAYQSILEEKLTKEELQVLLDKQKEIQRLKKDLASLGIRKVVQKFQAQILQPTKPWTNS